MGIQWNNKGNLMLLTGLPCSSEDLAANLATIEQVVLAAAPGTITTSKNETWMKVTIHGVSTTDYEDNEQGMIDLQREIEAQQRVLLAQPPRYLTRPEKRVGKSHSSVVLCFRAREDGQQIIRNGCMLFGVSHRAQEYFSNRPADHCTNCLEYGHLWQRCKASHSFCGICASIHKTKDHLCGTCSSREACPHIPPKCRNCSGEHRANHPACPAKKALYGTKAILPRGTTITDYENGKATDKPVTSTEGPDPETATETAHPDTSMGNTQGIDS